MPDTQEDQNQKRVREQQERDAKASETQEKKYNEFVSKIAKDVEDFANNENFHSDQRGSFFDRVRSAFGNIKTVAAASKVRQSAVVEQPAEDGRPGVQIKPLREVVAGNQPVSGQSMPTANVNKAPGTKDPVKTEDKK